jgi:transcriptional regulator with XRE-family HTH domain
MAKREMTWQDVRRLLEREIAKAGGQSAYADRLGCSKQYISQVMSGQCPPSERLCKALGIRELGMRWETE